MAGLFSPSAVGPYLRPQAPANLPIGLQQMGQLNAQGAQGALRFNAKATQAGVLATGASISLGVGGALAGSAVAEGLYSASLRAAVTFPRATAGLTGLGNAMTGTTLPRVAIGAGTAAVAGGVGSTVLSEVEANPAIAQETAQTLAPGIQASLPATTAPATGPLPRIIDANVLAQAADRGNANALSAIRAGQPYVTLSQLREFLDVATESQQTQRAQLLLEEGVMPLPTQYGQLSSPQISSTFWQIANQQGKGDTTGDAALVVQGLQSGYTIVTGDGRLINTIQQTLQIPGVTFIRVQF